MVDEIEELYKLGTSKLKNLSHEQLIVLKTANDNTYCFSNNPLSDASGEDKIFVFLENKDETEIKYILCLWKKGDIDIPSFNFRKRLLELSLSNDNTKLILQGFTGLICKDLKLTMPKEHFINVDN